MNIQLTPDRRWWTLWTAPASNRFYIDIRPTLSITYPMHILRKPIHSNWCRSLFYEWSTNICIRWLFCESKHLKSCFFYARSVEKVLLLILHKMAIAKWNASIKKLTRIDIWMGTWNLHCFTCSLTWWFSNWNINIKVLLMILDTSCNSWRYLPITT